MWWYNLFIRSYGLIIKLAAFFNHKANKWVEGRVHFWEKLPVIENKSVVWFHCASLGEFEQGRPIIDEWKKNSPNDYILLTFFSPSGYEVRKDYPLVDHCCYLPLDTPRNAQRFIAHFHPHKAFFVKYEFWLNFILEANKLGCELYSLSGIFRKEHRFFKWYGGVFRRHLKLFNHFFVQNETSKTLLNSINITNVTVTGDTRYDRVYSRAQSNSENELLKNWLGDEKAFVIGSSWPVDEKLILPFLNQLSCKIILAPHQVDETHITQIIKQLNLSYAKYTDLDETKGIPPFTRVLILDCIGVLADAYRYGSIAYIGGAFGTGLHNILEPAAFGLPTIFGPKHEKFPEAQAFIDAGIGFSLRNEKELAQHLTYVFDHLEDLHHKTRDFIEQNTGATQQVFSYIISNK